ncbi:hypothetical protein YQE_02665, partial [Dendroctonus ponderosae]
MGLSVILIALLLLQSALSLTDDSFEGYEIFGPDEEADMEPYMNRQSRGNDKFLRFEKAFWDYESGNEAPYSDKADQRPPRTGRQGKNDHFIRFGRRKQDFRRVEFETETKINSSRFFPTTIKVLQN